MPAKEHAHKAAHGSATTDTLDVMAAVQPETSLTLPPVPATTDTLDVMAAVQPETSLTLPPVPATTDTLDVMAAAPDGDFLLEDAQAQDVPVRAATLPALVSIVVAAFDDQGVVRANRHRLPRVVFLMHRWFTSSPQLAALLVAQYRGAHQAAHCAVGCAQTGCAGTQLQARICHAFRFWISEFPMQFVPDGELASRLRDFQATLPAAHARLVDVSQVPAFDWMRHLSVRSGNGAGAQAQVSLVLYQLQPLELAEHITYLEHKLVRRIDEYRRYATSGVLSDTPRLGHSIALFNGLTQWIQCLVLSHPLPQQRADVVAKFVTVAQKLLELQNFNSLMAVVGSVDHSAVARLSKTMACLTPPTRKALADLTDLLSSANNFANYRRALAACQGFKIPILGLHLKDLTCLHVALPDRLDKDMLNVRKMAQMAVVFEELEELQKSAPSVDANPDLVNTLRLSLDLAYTEDEIYELSLSREPRSCSSQQSSPTQSVVFAEWAATPSPPPHPATIAKHVNAMVEAVFKNYDADGDGCISHTEFRAVAGNFPFIAAFGVLDADHDGMISQEEMKKYFISANCHALKSGFKHDFHETTYFKPTFCAHCTGLLWGLIRQGFKCRDCAINAHKHCKDLVVMECRLRTHSTHGEGSSHGATARRKFRVKKKSSASESSASTSLGESEGPARGGEGSGGSLPSSPRPSSARRKVSNISVDSGQRHVDKLASNEVSAAPAAAPTHGATDQ